MAVDMFIKIGNLKGEAKDHKHKNEIDVLSWSWAMSQSGSFHHGGGGGAGKCNVNDISFTKWIDNASADLMKHCVTGEHIKQATLVVRKAGKSPLEYYKITMDKVLVTSVSTGGSGGEERLTENVSLNFAKVKVEHDMQNDDGTKGDHSQMVFDIEANE